MVANPLHMFRKLAKNAWNLLARRKPGSSISRPAAWLLGNDAPRQLDQADALSLSAIFQAVRILAQTVGMLPLQVFRMLPNGGREKAISHPAWFLLHHQPNPWMTAKTFRQTLEVHRLLWGNALAEIVWTRSGNVAELWPLEPWSWKPKIDDDGDLIYFNASTGEKLAREDVLHIPNLSFDGVVGACFLDYASKALGLDIDAQDFASAFFANGAQPGGFLTHEQDPGEDQRNKMRESFEKVHKGAKNANRLGVIWGGWKYDRTAGSIDPEKAQLLEQRRFTVEEVARWFNLPPHMLRDLSRATFSNIEEQQIEAVVYTFLPILIDYEQEYDRKILKPPQLFSKHNIGGLLRGNTAARTTYYKEMFGIGAITNNIIADFEEQNPIGPEGDLRFVPMNMTTLKQAFDASKQPPAPVPPPVPKEAPPPPTEDKQEGNDLAARAWLADTLDRFRRKECNAIKRAAGNPSQFLSWMESFYPNHQALLTSALRPVLPLCQLELNAESMAKAEADRSYSDLLELSGQAKASELPIKVQSLLAKEWNNRTGELLSSLFEKESHENPSNN